MRGLSPRAYFMSKTGILFVVSGPSGSGKSTLVSWAVKELPNLRYSISYTSRAPREGERHAVNYFFESPAEFERMIAAGEFLEWAQVYGNYYGTHRRAVEADLNGGIDIIMDIDVQGAKILRQKCPNAVLIFIFPPTFEVLMARITARRLDSDEIIRQRLHVARDEMAAFEQYDYLIVNDTLGEAQRDLGAIIRAHRCRRAAREHLAYAILQSVP